MNDNNIFENLNNDNTLFNNNYNIYTNNYNNYYNRPKYNIDLFQGVKEEFEKDKNSSNNIYLNFYNKHTKNQVLQDFTDLNKKYYDINMENIKEKEYKYKKRKEEEEYIKKKKEKEDTNEYRKEQMLKLYANQLNKFQKQLNSNKKYLNIKPKVYNNIKNNTNKNIISKSKPKIELKQNNHQIIKKDEIKKRNFSYQKKLTENSYNNNKYKNYNDINKEYKISLNNKIKEVKYNNMNKNVKHNKIISKGNLILMSKKEYDKTIKDLKEKAKMYVNELDKLKYNGKSLQSFERQIELSQLIDKIRKDIDKYQSKIGLKIIDN